MPDTRVCAKPIRYPKLRSELEATRDKRSYVALAANGSNATNASLTDEDVYVQLVR